VNISTLFDLDAFSELSEAHDWARPFGDAIDEWWRQCPHGDAMLHALVALEVPFDFLLIAALACAQTAQDLLPQNMQADASHALASCLMLLRGELSEKKFLNTFKTLITHARAQRMSESEACAVSAVAMVLERPNNVPALVSDARAIAAHPKHNTGMFDEADYKRVYDDANEKCAHAIREMVPDDLVKQYFSTLNDESASTPS
jgi:hypothetical protein